MRAFWITLEQRSKMRRQVDGLNNPHYRKYVRYEPYCDVVREYFRLFKLCNSNLKRTWEQIEQFGPFIPEFEAHTVPTGFLFQTHIRKPSRYTNKLIVSQ